MSKTFNLSIIGIIAYLLIAALINNRMSLIDYEFQFWFIFGLFDLIVCMFIVFGSYLVFKE